MVTSKRGRFYTYHKSGQGLKQNGAEFQNFFDILSHQLYGIHKSMEMIVLLQNGAAFSSINRAKGIIKQGLYYKTRQGLLQNGEGITKPGNDYKTSPYSGASTSP